jgi:dihydroxyacetone kinase-like predicted kinase
VVILPNNKNIRPVAEQVDALSDKTVRVVATGSIVEGFAALLAYDPAAGAAVNAASMGESAARVVPARSPGPSGTPPPTPARCTRATGSASRATAWSPSPTRRDGDAPAAEPPARARHELVTLIEGEGAKVADTRKISEWLSEEYPDVALEVHHGGQPLYPYLLGIE